jgi:glutaredoxin 3
MTRLTLFTTEPCSFCRNAKALLQKRGIPYDEINLAKDPVGRAELARRTGLMTFPQIVVDGETLGGFRELLMADESGALEDLAAAA